MTVTKLGSGRVILVFFNRPFQPPSTLLNRVDIPLPGSLNALAWATKAVPNCSFLGTSLPDYFVSTTP